VTPGLVDKVDDDIRPGSGGDFGLGCRLNSDRRDQPAISRSGNGVFIRDSTTDRFDLVR